MMNLSKEYDPDKHGACDECLTGYCERCFKSGCLCAKSDHKGVLIEA